MPSNRKSKNKPSKSPASKKTETSANAWISQLDVGELIALAPPLAMAEMGMDVSMDDVASFLSKGGPIPPRAGGGRTVLGFGGTGRDNRPSKRWWEATKKELYILMCTDDEKWADLRRELNSIRPFSTKVAVGTISVFLGTYFSISAAFFGPFCTTALYFLFKGTTEVYCTTYRDTYR